MRGPSGMLQEVLGATHPALCRRASQVFLPREDDAALARPLCPRSGGCTNRERPLGGPHGVRIKHVSCLRALLRVLTLIAGTLARPESHARSSGSSRLIAAQVRSAPACPSTLLITALLHIESSPNAARAGQGAMALLAGCYERFLFGYNLNSKVRELPMHQPPHARCLE